MCLAHREGGFHAAIDHKNEGVAAALDMHCSDGIDVFFDNVGGDALDHVLARINQRARIVICGAIARYSQAELPPGPRNYINRMIQRSRMEGFVLLDYAPCFGEGFGALQRWIAEGQLVWEVDVQRGFENIPETRVRLYTGANFGEQLLEL